MVGAGAGAGAAAGGGGGGNATPCAAKTYSTGIQEVADNHALHPETRHMSTCCAHDLVKQATKACCATQLMVHALVK